MSRANCSAKTCFNSYSKTPLMKFFPFPNDEKRARQWIKSCQREDLLDVPLDKLSKSYFLCSAHFEEKWFRHPKFKVKFKPNVNPVPTIFVNNFTEFLPKSIQSKISSKIVGKSDSSNEILKEDQKLEPIGCKESANKLSNVLCRLCAEEIQSENCINIFLDSSCSLRKMIEYLLPEKVYEDELPHFVCSSCETKVINCINTIFFFEETYKHLKGTFSEISLNKPSNSEEILQADRWERSNYESDKTDILCLNIKSDSISVNDKPMINQELPKSTELLNKSNKNNMIKCSYCLAEFNSIGFAKCHEKEVHKKKINSEKGLSSKCVKCNKVMPIERLKKHMESHMPKENQCEYCGIIYKTEKRLAVHLSTHETNLFCSFCGKDFSNLTQKRLHEKTHTDDCGMLCDICGRLFSEQRVLDNHMKSHDKANDNICPICSKPFKSECDLKLHLDSNPFRFSCPVCNKKFHVKARLQQHLSTHSNNGLFTCSCGVSFNRIGNLTQHRKQKHEDSDENENVETFQCSVCLRKINSKMKLKWHMAKHNGDKKPYDCELCGKKHSTIVKYKNHMRTHTGERPFSCMFCARTFSSKENVKQHEIIHRDIYPHQCNFCNRGFKRVHSLVIHKRSHTGERPFTCDICLKRFYQRYDMLKHQKVHNKPSNRKQDKNLIQNCVKSSETLNSLTSFIPEPIDVNESKLIEIPELEVVNVEPTLPATSFQLFSMDNIPQLTLTTADLQLLNMPIMEIQPLM